MSTAVAMTVDHRQYVRNETIISIVLNVIVSGLFAWFPFHDQPQVPLWGPLGIAVDLIPTTFMITLALTIALTLITRGRMRKGKIPPLAWPGEPRPWYARLPMFPLFRALLLALCFTAVLVPLFVATFLLLGIDALAFPTFFSFKLVYGGMLAVIVTPLILVAALSDGSR